MQKTIILIFILVVNASFSVAQTFEKRTTNTITNIEKLISATIWNIIDCNTAFNNSDSSILIQTNIEKDSVYIIVSNYKYDTIYLFATQYQNNLTYVTESINQFEGITYIDLSEESKFHVLHSGMRRKQFYLLPFSCSVRMSFSINKIYEVAQTTCIDNCIYKFRFSFYKNSDLKIYALNENSLFGEIEEGCDPHFLIEEIVYSPD